MEKYPAAAEEISATSSTGFGKQFEAVSGQQLPTGAASPGDSAGLLCQWGDKLFRASALGWHTMELSLGALAGNEPPLAAVFIDDKKIREIPFAKMNDPEVYTLSVRLRAGKRTVKIAVNDFYVETEAMSQPKIEISITILGYRDVAETTQPN